MTHAASPESLTSVIAEGRIEKTSFLTSEIINAIAASPPLKKHRAANDEIELEDGSSRPPLPPLAELTIRGLKQINDPRII